MASSEYGYPTDEYEPNAGGWYAGGEYGYPDVYGEEETGSNEEAVATEPAVDPYGEYEYHDAEYDYGVGEYGYPGHTGMTGGEYGYPEPGEYSAEA